MGTTIGVLAAVLFSYVLFEVGTIVTDFQVYRGSIHALLAGGDLYGFEVHTRDLTLPFTYPPFAALVLLPTALGSEAVATWAWVLAQCLLLLVAVRVVITQTPQAARGRTIEGALLTALGFLLLLATDPVMSDVILGQVSLGLVALVLVDLLVIPTRWRGVLTGVAAAVKLTPIVFVGYLLVTRQWKQAANAIAATLAATAIGLAVLPSESLRYWTDLVWRTGRVGEIAAQRNKSLLGVLNHFDLPDGVQRPVWLVLVGVLVVAVLWSAHRQHLRGGEFGAVVSVGLLGCLITPIAWPHHLIWLPLAGLYLVYLGRPLPRLAGIGVLAACLTWSPLLSYETSDQVWLNILGDGSVLVAVLVAVIGLPASRSNGMAVGASASNASSDTPVGSGP
jgi:alpha-1,2-mannosyltransferase